ncbi:hypothetical protein BLNAU_20701 [Blattamonas nauphoetae]|uniref:Uncharacterized protein n=1 Tax=Blattamonas nauphoetae TaxID=2049346 RepID=A0ABQ9WY14_9EUKA|nr:hypothetical protein BLNAU_20701 [Blattamonas nauphoetae]
MNLLSTLILIGPFHLPTLEFVLASPIVMAISSYLTYTEGFNLYRNLGHIHSSLLEWQAQCTEVRQSGKRMIQALISEGFEDTLEQMMKHANDGYFHIRIVVDYASKPLSRMTPTHFCGLYSDVGNALIAGADEQTINDPLQPSRDGFPS